MADKSRHIRILTQVHVFQNSFSPSRVGSALTLDPKGSDHRLLDDLIFSLDGFETLRVHRGRLLEIRVAAVTERLRTSMK